MKRETIDWGHGRAEILKEGSLIYLDVYGVFTDEDVLWMTHYLEGFFDEVGGPTTRVWNTEHISKGGYLVTPGGTDKLAAWAREARMKWPHNTAYLIATNALTYGTCRMYELKSNNRDSTMFVIESFDELPEELRDLILGGLKT